MKRRSSVILIAVLGGLTLSVCAAAHQGCLRDNLKLLTLRVGGPDLYTSLKAASKPVDGSAIGMRAMPPEGASATAIIDKYGQYANANWAGKIHDDSDLTAERDAEGKELADHPAPGDLDEYGGWTSGPQLKATGFFRTERVDGKWWLVTPSGHEFFSVGMSGVDNGSATMVSGREQLFAWLPDHSGPLSDHYGTSKYSAHGVVTQGDTFDFYGANLERKYGADYKHDWADSAVARFHSWGFNTLGNWSELTLEHADKIPYTADMNIPGDYHTVSGGDNHWGRMPDPFDPKFAQAAEVRMKLITHLVGKDPWCIGYIIDNELSWRGYDDKARYSLAYGALGEDASSSPAKQAFVDLLKSRYTTVDKLNQAWNAQYLSWDDLGAAQKIQGDLTPAQTGDFAAFVEAYAEQYFRIVSTTLKALDPNHLYLGSRIAEHPGIHPEEEVFRAAARYCDVITFNYYGRGVDNEWSFIKGLGKPLMVTEFHFGATDRGTFWPGLFDAGSQQSRADDYKAYVESAAENPAIVGCHWFDYLDQPVTGRLWDGENAGIGFVDITDTPYPDMVKAAREENPRVYVQHSGS